MHIVIGLAIGLIIAGLAMCWLCGGIKEPILSRIVYWVGVVLVIIGLILLLTPVLIWINAQLQAMLGHP